MMELEFKGGIGIKIELKGFGPESELNRNRLLPELHIIDYNYLNQITQ